jgi:type I restriction enzyme M protein
MGANVKTNLIFFDKTGSTKEIWYGEVIGKFTKKKNIQDMGVGKKKRREGKKEKRKKPRRPCRSGCRWWCS